MYKETEAQRCDITSYQVREINLARQVLKHICLTAVHLPSCFLKRKEKKIHYHKNQHYMQKDTLKMWENILRRKCHLILF